MKNAGDKKMKNKLIELSLAALLFGCASPREVRRPEISARFSFSGYTISKGNIHYRFINESIEGCTMYLGSDAILYDHDCNGAVNEFYDNQGRHSCEENRNEKCNLADRIFEQKREMLKVNQIHQCWLECMSRDALSGYLD